MIASSEKRAKEGQSQVEFVERLKADGFDTEWMLESYAYIAKRCSVGRIDAETVSYPYAEFII